MAKKRRRVALLIETSNSYARGILRGINRFQQVHEDWAIFFPEQERGAPPPAWLKTWKCDGLIARIETQEIADFVYQLDTPTVDVSAARLLEDLPWVETNDDAIGRLAVEHLSERGFRNFGYYHDPGFNWSTWRLDSFQSALVEKGFDCNVLTSTPFYDPSFSWSDEYERLAKWLVALPKPAGIMACYDVKGRQVLEACSELDIPVPEQVAVIGVDNDPLICDACHPPLTSISLNSFQAGYVAASMVDRMMNGESIDDKTIRIDPIEIEERLSTDTVAVDDPDVAIALRFIRENATRNIRVDDILREVDISRRKLESRFKRIVGRTPHQEIQRRRIHRIKYLLRNSDLSIAQIADLTGYDHPEYLSVAFQRETGQTLTEFRKTKRRQAAVRS